MKSFYVCFTLKVDEEGNILSLVEESHAKDVAEVVQNAMHDVDDIKVEKLKVKEGW